MHNKIVKNGRCYYNDGYRMRSACICVRNESEDEVLLVTSSRNKDIWVVPGGGIELNENAEQAAIREAYEEAGVRGDLNRFLGVFDNVEKKKRTHVYLLIVKSESEKWEDQAKFGRIKKWFSLEEAIQILDKSKPMQSVFLSSLKGTTKNA